MLDALTTAEIQALRLELYHFANRQTDSIVQSRCLTVVSMLGEAVERDDPIIRADLAKSVELLEEALRDIHRATEPSTTLSLVSLTIADAKARFAEPIVLSFHR